MLSSGYFFGPHPNGSSAAIMVIVSCMYIVSQVGRSKITLSLSEIGDIRWDLASRSNRDTVLA